MTGQASGNPAADDAANLLAEILGNLAYVDQVATGRRIRATHTPQRLATLTGALETVLRAARHN